MSPQQFHEILRRLYWEQGIILEPDPDAPDRFMTYAFPSWAPILIIEFDGEKVATQQYGDMFDTINTTPDFWLPQPPSNIFSTAPRIAGKHDNDFYIFESKKDTIVDAILRSPSMILDLPSDETIYSAVNWPLDILNDLDRQILDNGQYIIIDEL